MLGLAWTKHGPGAALEQFCAEFDFTSSDITPFPRPMKGRLGFSYASLHSHVERYVEALGGIEQLDLPHKVSLARAFQTAAVAQLEEKVSIAFNWCFENHLEVHDLVISGGVASNRYLRDHLSHHMATIDAAAPISLHFPPPSLCTDNAVMIAWASMHRFLARDYDDYTIDLRPNWSIDALSG